MISPTTKSNKKQCDICNKYVTNLKAHKKGNGCIGTIINREPIIILRERIHMSAYTRDVPGVDNTLKIECDRCGMWVMPDHMKFHQDSVNCARIIQTDNRTQVCERCGIVAFECKIVMHMSTIGCLTSYFSKVTERPFNLQDQMRYDYLQQKRSYFKNKNEAYRLKIKTS
jgi:hypothetical protein